MAIPADTGNHGFTSTVTRGPLVATTEIEREGVAAGGGGGVERRGERERESKERERESAHARARECVCDTYRSCHAHMIV